MHGPLQWWYYLSLPGKREQATASAPQEREQLRYAHLTSGFLFLFALIYIPASILMFLDSPPGSSAPTIALISGSLLIITFILGKIGLQRASAITLLAFIQVTIISDLATNPLDPALFQIVYALLFAVILAGAILPPGAALVVSGVNCISMILIILFVQHTTSWSAEIQRGRYSVLIFLPLCLQIGIAIICYVIMRNLTNTLQRAYRAEEIIALQQAIAEHEESRTAQQQQLEEALKRIVDVHARIANGDLSARVSLTEGDVLWSVAVPLNHLLNRLQAAKHTQDVYSNLQKASHNVAEQLHTIIQTRQFKLIPVTGTILDPIILEINQLVQNSLRQSSSLPQKPQ